MIRLIDDALLDEVCAEAAASPRRRKNRNFHSRDDQPAHRLLNAMQANSYIPPHRHLHPDKAETMVVLRGALAVLEFDDSGKVIATSRVGDGETAHSAAMGVDIPSGTWHTVIALVDGTVFLEAKAGPYLPLSDEEKAPWAPGENDAAAPAYFKKLKSLFSGEELK
jgi:cupin fold WbuC family metalloprotein